MKDFNSFQAYIETLMTTGRDNEIEKYFCMMNDIDYDVFKVEIGKNLIQDITYENDYELIDMLCMIVLHTANQINKRRND